MNRAVPGARVPDSARAGFAAAIRAALGGRRRLVAVLALLAAGCESQPDDAEHPGKAVYERYCYACHQAGIADAPRLGDKEAWAPRLEQTRAELVANVKNGMPPGMPPRAGCSSCSDEALEAAVDFMVLRVE